MPYSVLTKDGIQLNNIPDNIPRDSDELRQRVEQIRESGIPQTQNQPLDLDQPNILQDGEGSDFFRGIGSYKDQFGGIVGGAEVLAGKAVDSDEMIMSGVKRMQESEEAINRRGVKNTDNFLGAYDEGIGAVLTEFIPYIAGQGVGMIAEALVTATAGAIVGSAAAPGFGTLGGALTGFVGRELVKEGIIDAANTLTKKERNALIRRETARIIQTDAGKQAIKELYTKAGKVTALSGMAAKFGAGETTGRAIDEAIRDIEDPQEQLAKIKELSTGKLAAVSTAHALANYIGLKIGLGSLEKMAAPTQNVLLNIAKNISFTGLKEAPVEAIQSGLERYGADLPLTDRAAIDEYINASAAGFVMPIVPATIGGLRSGPISKKPEDPEESDSDINQDIKLSDTIDGKNLTDEETKQKQKGWTLNSEETKRRKNINKDQESANTDHENLDQYDSNDANIDITRRNVPQQATLPGFELTPEEQQALIATGIGGQDVQRNDGTRSAEQGELGVGVETPVLSRAEGDAENVAEPFGTTVDTSKSSVTRTTGRKRGLDTSLKPTVGKKSTFFLPDGTTEEVEVVGISEDSGRILVRDKNNEESMVDYAKYSTTNPLDPSFEIEGFEIKPGVYSFRVDSLTDKQLDSITMRVETKLKAQQANNMPGAATFERQLNALKAERNRRDNVASDSGEEEINQVKGRKKVKTKKTVVTKGKKEEIKLPPINNNLSVEEEQSFKNIREEQNLTDQQFEDLKETYIANRNVRLREQGKIIFEEEQKQARQKAEARRRTLDRENKLESEEVSVDDDFVDNDIDVSLPTEEQLIIPGLEPTLTEREEVIRRIGAQQESGGRGQITGRPDVRDSTQQELPEIETIEEFEEQRKRIEDKANQENRPLPAQIIEFFRTFQNIEQSEGIDAARQYRRNRLANPEFKALFDGEQQAQAAINTTIQEQTKKPEDFRSDNKQDAVNYQKENNLENDYFIKEEKEFASIINDKGEQVVVERPTDFTLEKRKTFKSINARDNIVDEIASHMTDYESRTPGKVYSFKRIIRDAKGTKEQQKNLIDKFLKDTLNKQQYKDIANNKIYRTNKTGRGDLSILNGVINLYIEKTILETTGYKEQEIAISKERIENFDTYDVAILLKQQAYDLGLVNDKGEVQIPAFIKTGASFGSKRAPIETATDIDSLMKAVLGDYIYEQFFDTVLSVPKDPAGREYDIASFINNGRPADLERRKEIRDEFFNSPLFDAYLARKNITKKRNKNLSLLEDKSVEGLVEQEVFAQRRRNKFVKKFVAPTQYLDGRTYLDDVRNDNKIVSNVARGIKDKAELAKDKARMKEEIKENSDYNAIQISETTKRALAVKDYSSITQSISMADNARVALESIRDYLRRQINKEPVKIITPFSRPEFKNKLTLKELEFQLMLTNLLLRIPGLTNIKTSVITPENMEKISKKTNVLGVYVSQYDTGKNEINVVPLHESGFATKVFLHEAVHAVTVEAFKPGNLSSADLQQWESIFRKARETAIKKGFATEDTLGEPGTYYGLKNIKEFVAETFSNPDFASFLQSIESESQPQNKLLSLFDDFVDAVKNLLGIGEIDNTLLGDTIKMSGNLLKIGVQPKPNSKEAKELKKKQNFLRAEGLYNEDADLAVIDFLIPPSTRENPDAFIDISKSEGKKNKKTTELKNRTDEERISSNEVNHEKRTVGVINKTARFLKSWFGDGQNSIDKITKTFALRSFDIKKWQDKLEKSQLLVSGVEGFNNVFTQLTLAYGKADKHMKKLMLPLQNYEERLVEFTELYKQQNPGASDARARAVLQDIMTGEHEFERRQIKYILTVPLSKEKILKLQNNETISPAELRNKIMKVITTKEWTDPEQRMIDLQKYKQDLVTLTDPTNKVSGKNTVDGKAGVSYLQPDKEASLLSTNIKDTEYDISVLTYDKAQQLRNKFKAIQRTNPELYSAITKVRETLTTVQTETKRLNSIGNYAGPQALNIIDFYGWENYIPLKTKQDIDVVSDSLAQILDPTTERLSRDLKRLDASFEGNQSDAEDPFTQTVVDASLAAARAGRVKFTQAIFNAVTTEIEYTNSAGKKVKTTAMKGKVERIFSYEERYKNDPDIQTLLKRKDTIIHHLPDGSLAVISIKDENLLTALRGVYDDKNTAIDILNHVTGAIGQMHTRFNFKFAPVNFIRDTITNLYIIGTDLGLSDMLGFAQNATEQITKGGFKNTWQIIDMYNKGNMDALDAYVKKELKKGNTYPRDMRDYLEEGGIVSYSQALSNQSAFERQQKAIGATLYLKTQRDITTFFDTYMGTFELASRVAAFRIFKNNYLARNAPGLTREQTSPEVIQAANEEAAAYAKRLSNFEEMGTAGRTLGGLFMFFRASAVGAARAAQSIGPAFRNQEALEAQLPDYILGNPEALKNFREKTARDKAAAQTMLLTGISMGMAVFYLSAALAGEDEEDSNKTFNDDLSRWTRFARFDMNGVPGFKKGDVIQIPWGFGLGGIPAIGAQLAGMVSANENTPLSIFGNIVNITLDSFAPLPISRMDPSESPLAWLIDSAVPTMARPVVEFTMNKNAFGSPIYNELYTKRYGDAFQAGDNVPAMFKDLAIFMAEKTNGTIDFNPNVMHFFANNYVDAIATTMQNFYSLGYLTATGKQDFQIKSDTIFFGSFFSKYSEVNQRAYARANQKMVELQRKTDLFKDVNPQKYDELLGKNPQALVMIQLNNSMKAQLKKLQKQAGDIRKAPALSRRQRAQLLEQIKFRQLMLKRQITNMVDQAIPE